MKAIFKIVFTIVFFAIAALWILYTLFFFGFYDKGWEWAQNIPGVSSLGKFISDLTDQGSYGAVRYIGLQMFLAGGAILLGYTAIYFPLKLIPFLGSLIKFLTAIIPTVASIVLIIGALLLWGPDSWWPGFMKDKNNGGEEQSLNALALMSSFNPIPSFNYQVPSINLGY